MKMTKTELKKWEKHCRAEYPNEACALVVDKKVIPTPNRAKDPARAFSIDPQHYAKAMTEGRLDGVLHSHVIDAQTDPKQDPRTPSHADMVSWLAMNIPFGISAVNADQVSELLWLEDDFSRPLEGRTFQYGISDCFSLVRDYYFQKFGIKLKNYPRENGWDQKADHITNRFDDAGFYEISKDELAIGDLLVMRIRAPYPNHLAVMVSQNVMLHQMYGRISGRETIAKWGPYITSVLRYKAGP